MVLAAPFMVIQGEIPRLIERAQRRLSASDYGMSGIWRPWEDVASTSSSPLISLPFEFRLPESGSPALIQTPPMPTSPPTRRCVRCKCPNCQLRTFTRESKQLDHICHFEGCGKTYKKTSHLRAHLRSHIGCRPFICQWPSCGFSFARSDQLQRHSRSHTGERRHACRDCGRRFSRSDHLKQHQNSQHPMIVVD